MQLTEFCIEHNSRICSLVSCQHIRSQNNEGQYCMYPSILLQSIECVCVLCTHVCVHACVCVSMSVCVCVCVHSSHWYTLLSQTILMIDYTTITHC